MRDVSSHMLFSRLTMSVDLTRLYSDLIGLDLVSSVSDVHVTKAATPMSHSEIRLTSTRVGELIISKLLNYPNRVIFKEFFV